MSELEQLRKEVNELRERLAFTELRLSQLLSIAQRQAQPLCYLPFPDRPIQQSLTCFGDDAP